MSLAAPITIVGRPFRSRYRATRLTVWWQTGQVGDEKGGVDLVLPAARQDLRRIGVQRHPLAAVGRRAVKTRGEPETALVRELAHQRQREPGARVLGRGVLAVVADVADARIVIVCGVA
jgi:hypothetical protein